MRNRIEYRAYGNTPFYESLGHNLTCQCCRDTCRLTCTQECKCKDERSRCCINRSAAHCIGEMRMRRTFTNVSFNQIVCIEEAGRHCIRSPVEYSCSNDQNPVVHMVNEIQYCVARFTYAELIGTAIPIKLEITSTSPWFMCALMNLISLFSLPYLSR